MPNPSSPGSASPPPERRGDEVLPGTPQSAEGLCPQCGGSGKAEGSTCPTCGGTGQVTVNVGDA